MFIKKMIYMLRRPERKKHKTEKQIVKPNNEKLPATDYDGMGDFSRFGRP
jgi:hypothetical protein